MGGYLLLSRNRLHSGVSSPPIRLLGMTEVNYPSLGHWPGKVTLHCNHDVGTLLRGQRLGLPRNTNASIPRCAVVNILVPRTVSFGALLFRLRVRVVHESVAQPTFPRAVPYVLTLDTLVAPPSALKATLGTPLIVDNKSDTEW